MIAEAGDLVGQLCEVPGTSARRRGVGRPRVEVVQSGAIDVTRFVTRNADDSARLQATRVGIAVFVEAGGGPSIEHA